MTPQKPEARRQARRRAKATPESARLEAMVRFERRLWAQGVSEIAGVDEVGVGPLAGPVVAAAVILPPHVLVAGVDDSKRLSARQRARAAVGIREVAVAIAIGTATVEEIDRHNILQASLLAMQRAVLALPRPAAHLLVDARTVPAVPMPQQAIIRGDQRSLSIAAASIIAKLYRDDLMAELAGEYPGYGFEAHNGYPTPAHLEALARLGPCPIHRRSFKPVARAATRTAGAAALSSA